ncbi:MAG: hypothetical protein JRG82_17860 [Deltaproteobacteria bacterium]|nr:hypothetical protein [Deltaproteobacteria bacterium]
MMSLPLLPTTPFGSYSQPDWLIDGSRLGERLVIAPDCGLKYLPRDVSFAKLQSMVRGRNLVRAELA